MTERNIFFGMFLALLVLSAFLAVAALAENSWRGFWVTELQLVATYLALRVLLRRTKV